MNNYKLPEVEKNALNESNVISNMSSAHRKDLLKSQVERWKKVKELIELGKQKSKNKYSAVNRSDNLLRKGQSLLTSLFYHIVCFSVLFILEFNIMYIVLK